MTIGSNGEGAGVASVSASMTATGKSELSVGLVLVIVAATALTWNVFSPIGLLARAMVQFGLATALASGTILILLSLGTISNQLDKITLSLAVAAIVFAVWQFRDARAGESRTKGLASRMEELAKNMSTRFIGYFPKNLPDIDELASHADRGLDVMCDYVGYGHYAAPEDFDRYYRKLQDLPRKGVQVRVLVYTRDKAEETYDTQFTEARFCAALAEKDSKLVRFCQKFNTGFCEDFNSRKDRKEPYKFDCKQLDSKSHPPSDAAFNTSKKELDDLRSQFKELMFRKQKDYMKELMERGVNIRKTDTGFPFYLWDEDDHEAVVSFLNEGAPNDQLEVSFRTRDTSLVEKTFKMRFEDLWKKAKDVGRTKDGEPDWLPRQTTSPPKASTPKGRGKGRPKRRDARYPR